MVKIINSAANGNWDKAREIHLAYHKVMSNMFLDTNPIPVKSAMAMLGLCKEVYRLPLCGMSDALKQQLQNTLKAAGVLK
jgi:4-hydroxy-tetrahydrodipicolinate synthase